MKQSNGLIISTIALAFLATGCVKKASTETATVYDSTQPTYESGAPIVYETTGATTSTGVVYSDVPTDNTVVTTGSAGGAYSNPYTTDTTYADPYANQATTTTNSSYASSTALQGSGIQLQVAALKDYYAAEEFKNSLNLDSKYTAYVQKGAVNKVIISGISSVAEANQLKATRFKDAFIIGGSSSASSYTTNVPYSSSSSTTAGGNGMGVQVGAFSSQSAAQSAADSASSQYRSLVKTGTSNGKTIYKAIVTGFASEQEARSFIAQRGGVGFLVYGL